MGSNVIRCPGTSSGTTVTQNTALVKYLLNSIRSLLFFSRGEQIFWLEIKFKIKFRP